MISPKTWRHVAHRYRGAVNRLWVWSGLLAGFLVVFNLLPLGRTRVGYFVTLLLLMALSEVVIVAGALRFFSVPKASAARYHSGRGDGKEWLVALGVPVLFAAVAVIFLLTLFLQIFP